MDEYRFPKTSWLGRTAGKSVLLISVRSQHNICFGFKQKPGKLFWSNNAYTVKGENLRRKFFLY